MVEHNNIRVEVGALSGWAAAIASDISAMEKLIGQLGEVVRRTSSYWRGEAGDRYRNIYFEQEEVRQEILQRLNNDPNKLSEIAKIFGGVAAAAVQEVEELPCDICGNGGGGGGSW